ncbi:MAG: Xaa-Pro peptidase family protein [Bryobacteraceae bacterium]
MNVYGSSIVQLLQDEIHGARLVSGSGALARLRATLTAHEASCVRAACLQAECAFRAGARALRAGLRETEVAAAFQERLSDTEGRAGGFAYCMSGPNAAEACAAYQRSRSRQLMPGDFALVHCNSYIDGFWTDITRTFSIGEPDARKCGMYAAVLEASRAAIDAVRPGVKAAEVDRAAREVLQRRGFGKEFKHATGHGVGFAAINHLAQPCIHPVSDDVLEPGMTFNIEPAIYCDGYGGLRHCDVVTVTSGGVEVLTPFQAGVSELTIGK